MAKPPGISMHFVSFHLISYDLSRKRAQVPWVKVCEASGYEDAAKSPEEALPLGLLRRSLKHLKTSQDVTFTELIAATFDRKRGLSEKMCRAAYQSFDKSGDRQVMS